MAEGLCVLVCVEPSVLVFRCCLFWCFDVVCSGVSMCCSGVSMVFRWRSVDTCCRWSLCICSFCRGMGLFCVYICILCLWLCCICFVFLSFGTFVHMFFCRFVVFRLFCRLSISGIYSGDTINSTDICNINIIYII